jgi:hypothetical protein
MNGKLLTGDAKPQAVYSQIPNKMSRVSGTEQEKDVIVEFSFDRGSS